MDQHLLTPHTVADYLAGMSRVTDIVADHLAVDAPSTGSTVADLTPGVEAVDLDRPAADLDAAVNTSVDTWDQSAGGTLIEQRLVRWTAERIGFGQVADGVFTSGGTQSNLQGLVLARGEALRRTGEGGASPRLRVLATEHSHFSVVKAAGIMGLHPDAVIPVPTDHTGGMSTATLGAALDGVAERDEVPMAVVATAGTTDLGVIDPVAGIADLCTAHGVWLHVDAAYGGGLLASRRRRHLLDGIERADSVTVDFHKTFFQPVSSSALVVRDAATLSHVTHHADYLNPRSAVTPNQVDKSLQTTRRFDALKLWLTLRVTGADAIGEMFDEVIDRAHQVFQVLLADDRFEVAAEPTLSTVLLRYRPTGVTVAEADALNPRIRHALLDRGDIMVAGTVLGHRAWLKFTLLNPHTSLDHLRGILETIAGTGEALVAALRDGAGASSGPEGRRASRARSLEGREPDAMDALTVPSPQTSFRGSGADALTPQRALGAGDELSFVGTEAR